MGLRIPGHVVLQPPVNPVKQYAASYASYAFTSSGMTKGCLECLSTRTRKTTKYNKSSPMLRVEFTDFALIESRIGILPDALVPKASPV